MSRLTGTGAGQSAYDVARRQRERAAQLQRSAELWERGADGEVAVARALEALPDGWVVLHDLPWPGRRRANLDHVVIGPGGVFVVDAKNWSGRIEVRDQVLSQNGRRREEAVSSATAAAIALQGVVSPHPCTGVLCFVREEAIAAQAWNVPICSISTLVEMLTARPHVLSPEEVARCTHAVQSGGVAADAAPAADAISSVVAPRRSKKRTRAVVTLLGALALVVALASGGYERAADWAGDRLAEVIVPGVPDEPTPTKPAKKREQGKKSKQDRKAQQGSTG